MITDDKSDPIPITEQTLEIAFEQIKTATFMLSLFDFAGFVEARRKIDSHLRVTDPTTYLKILHSKNLEDVVAAAQAAATFSQSMNDIRARAALRLSKKGPEQ